MNLLEIQIVTEFPDLPSEQQFQQWVDAALLNRAEELEVVIRMVDKAESAELNHQYRRKAGPTNILSFPFEPPEGMDLNLLGDLVICAPLIVEEARLQHKVTEHHWAHITIHGVLHLLGYDHVQDNDAEEMEALEIQILNTLNIANPYQELSTQ